MFARPNFLHSDSFRRCAAIGLILVLAACGGGAGTDRGDVMVEDAAAQTSRVDQERPTAGSAPDARLTEASLAAAEQQAQVADASPSIELAELKVGEIAVKTAYLSGEVARKAAAVRIPAYRFYNGSTGAHFFTVSEIERASVAATMSPPYIFEGAAFSVASDFSPGLSPVHRFYNTHTGVHFYTISEAERASVAATLPHFTYEGVAYHASEVAGAGLIPFYRFYVPSRGFHFYTASEAEKANIQANLSTTYRYEGVGYYVLSSDWRTEKLPHTGVMASQCYQAGSDGLVACGSANARNLNPQQDGHRLAINPMSYGDVPNPAGGNFPRTSCVKDNVTGLVWEGKTSSGERFGNNTYSNHGDGTLGDASAFVNRANQLALCGYTDWRLPKRNELLTLVDYGHTPKVPADWFPNSPSLDFWAFDGNTGNSTQAWSVSFGSGSLGGTSLASIRSGLKPVRLVRGTISSGSRFSFGTVPYGSDGPNNVVNDAWTGLQWRRCEQGRVWSGSGCTGSASMFTHQAAFENARAQAGWRLPNIKELSSVIDLGVGGSAARMDAAAFPGALALTVHASTPDFFQPYLAQTAYFGSGEISGSSRFLTQAVRLVRTGE